MSRYPFLVEQFLRQSGFPDPGVQRGQRLAEAIAYLHSEVPDLLPLAADNEDVGVNPFAFRINGRVTNLCAWVQAINLDMPVRRITVQEGTRLRMYKWPGFRRGSPPRGHWATTPDTPHSAVALPPGQSAAHGYVVTRPFSSLRSHAGDVLVDWSMRAPTDPYWYRQGGGVQFFIPDAAGVLRAL